VTREKVLERNGPRREAGRRAVARQVNRFSGACGDRLSWCWHAGIVDSAWLRRRLSAGLILVTRRCTFCSPDGLTGTTAAPGTSLARAALALHI